MNKIYIIGSVASGKTTLAKELSSKMGIKYYELDSIIFDDTKITDNKRSPEEQVKIINEINKEKFWIIEGTYRKSCHSILDLCDKIIFLDPLIMLRKIRIFTRYIKQKLNIEKCNYKSDWSMLKMMYKWTDSFEDNRKEFENILYKYNSKLIVIRNSKKIKKYTIGCKLE